MGTQVNKGTLRGEGVEKEHQGTGDIRSAGICKNQIIVRFWLDRVRIVSHDAVFVL